METQLPGAMALPPPAASTTPPGKMVGFCTGAWIVYVTGMLTEASGMPSMASLRPPLYTPTARSLAVTATLSVCGVAAAVGLTVSHLPFGGAADTLA
jgi:hypothetical protein